MNSQVHGKYYVPQNRRHRAHNYPRVDTHKSDSTSSMGSTGIFCGRKVTQQCGLMNTLKSIGHFFAEGFRSLKDYIVSSAAWRCLTRQGRKAEYHFHDAYLHAQQQAATNNTDKVIFKGRRLINDVDYKVNEVRHRFTGWWKTL